MKNVQHFNTYLSPSQIAKLQELNVRTRVPTAVRMREAVDMVLEKYGKKENIDDTKSPNIFTHKHA